MIDALHARARRGFCAFACVLAAGALAPCAADARNATPARQVRVAPSAPAPWHAVRDGSHTFFGTIVALRGTLLTLRLRGGRSLVVDAAAAVAHGDYSAPLFVGKIVTVDGDLRGATFVAAHIFRLPNLSELPADR